MDQLEKIDLLRERLGVSYRAAKEALELTNGDVVEALIMLENNRQDWDDKFKTQSDQILNQVKEIIKKGNVTKIKLLKKDKVVLELPATIGALGVVGVLAIPQIAILAAIGTVAGFVNDYKLEIEKNDGTIEVHDIKPVDE